MSNYVNIEQFEREMQQLTAMIRLMPERVIRPAVNRGLQRYGRAFVAGMQQSIRGSKDNKDVLHRRSGALARAFNHTVIGDAGSTSLYVWIDSTVEKYWRTQEYGAVINAKPGKALAIPVGPALTAAGVARYSSPREVPGLFMIKRFGKGPKLGRIEGKKIVIYFILAKKVEVPARLGLRDKWKQQVPLSIPIVKDELQKALSSFNGGSK